MRGRRWIAVFVLTALMLGVPYRALDRESRVLDEATRRQRGGRYVELGDGVTHYELLGSTDAPVVVLIHGGTIPLYVWDAQVPVLVDAGFRVLRYTHFGRGYSDRPDVEYDRALYQRQLDNLLRELDITGRVHLVGVSFGAAIAATFAKENPDRVDRLVFIAPVVDYTESRPLFTLAKVPLLGEWFARVFAVRKAVARATGFFEQANAPPTYAARFDEQTRIEGFERSLLSFSRTDALASYEETYASLADHPKLLIWGAQDNEIPRAHIDFLRAKLDKLTYVEIPHAGHGVTVESAQPVNTHLTSFLGTRSPSKSPSIPSPSQRYRDFPPSGSRAETEESRSTP
jgi:pimeloyl-ACP methyl ester carboxylesterase